MYVEYWDIYNFKYIKYDETECANILCMPYTYYAKHGFRDYRSTVMYTKLLWRLSYRICIILPLRRIHDPNNAYYITFQII